MAASAKLSEAIENRGVKKSFVAQQIGVSVSTFWRKMKGSSEFTLNEIRIIAATLRLTDKEICDIFFS
jgi:predicted transcriptional regulator